MEAVFCSFCEYQKHLKRINSIKSQHEPNKKNDKDRYGPGRLPFRPGTRKLEKKEKLDKGQEVLI